MDNKITAQDILNELLSRGLVDTDTVDEIAEDLKE